MTTLESPVEHASAPLAPARGRGLGIIAALTGVVSLICLARNTEGGQTSTLRFNPRRVDTIPDLDLPTQSTTIVLGLVGVALGILAVRAVRSRAVVLLGISFGIFALNVLIWAVRGDETSIFGLLDGTLVRSTPLVLGALGGLLCERSGIINIAIEGMMLAAAFTGALVGSAASSPVIGLIGGVLVGVLFGRILAALSIRHEVDQIIGGTVINIFALGLTSYVAARVLVEYADLNRPGTFRSFEVPLLSDIPGIGPLLFNQTIYVYLTFGLVGALTFGLFHTRWGLRLRACGEHPKAADTVGIDVNRTRTRSVMLGGGVAGLAGTWFTLDQVGSFNENMTAGRGFIALAALIFGRWHPVGAFSAALVFGFAEELQARLALLDTPIPSELLLMTPYAVTIVVVAGLIGHARPPAAEGVVYKTGT